MSSLALETFANRLVGFIWVAPIPGVAGCVQGELDESGRGCRKGGSTLPHLAAALLLAAISASYHNKAPIAFGIDQLAMSATPDDVDAHDLSKDKGEISDPLEITEGVCGFCVVGSS